MDNKFNNSLLSNYKRDSIELNDLLNKWDFLEVFPFNGGPKDEYNCLAGSILYICWPGRSKV
jgi:hypothetical protein